MPQERAQEEATQQRESGLEERFALNLMPDAESAAVFAGLEQLCPDVCFHLTFTISICSRNALHRCAFTSACKMCPDALKHSPLAAPCLGGLDEELFLERAVA